MVIRHVCLLLSAHPNKSHRTPGLKHCVQTLHCEVCHSPQLYNPSSCPRESHCLGMNSLLLCTFQGNGSCVLWGVKLDLPPNSTEMGVDAEVSKGLPQASIASGPCGCGGPPFPLLTPAHSPNHSSSCLRGEIQIHVCILPESQHSQLCLNFFLPSSSI